MKKVGREVLFLATSENNQRNGEGAFIRLNDGRIMYLYSKFIGDSWADHSVADIVAIYSSDEGETWGDERIVVHHSAEARNSMCPNLVRLNDGGIGLMYGRKINATLHNSPHFIRSYDEGETWTEPVICTTLRDQYYVKEHDHMIKMQNGRLLMPLNHHPLGKKEDGTPKVERYAKIQFIASDDNGKTWFELCDEIDLPYPEISTTGLQETTVYQRKDGSLHAFSRTDLLCQYECSSTDGGTTWTTPKPNPFFSSPESPLLLRTLNDDMVVGIFNPIPKYTTRYVDDKGRPSTASTRTNLWGRTPFIMAVSRNDGVSFDEAYYLEDDQTEGYCYPAIFNGGDYILVSYYHTNGSKIPLSSHKMIKIMLSELDG